MEIIENITIDDVRKAKPKKIFYGVNTCWWTHDPTHLCSTKTPKLTMDNGREIPPAAQGLVAIETSALKLLSLIAALPCDPRGGMLFETDNVEGFLKSAEEHAGHYGKHGLRAFLAAHHANCVVSLTDMRHTCFEGWQAYNDALDRLDARKAAHAD